MKNKEVKIYSWLELEQKAIDENKESMFIQVIKEHPMYPREFTDHDVKEFGLKVKANGDGNNNKWLLDFEFGYIMGYMHPSIKPKRKRGWFEVCFPYVDYKGNPTEYVIGMYIDELELL